MTTASSPTMETSLRRKPFAQLNLDERDDEDDNGEMPTLMSMVSGKSLKNKKKACQRRRRRSSVRFLKLSQITDENEEDADADDDGDEENAPESEQLGELYKRAIRMNAENRINAGNSWNLKLIENMDKLTSHENGETVNFTKASCTLDASVKIYSYRVDDVHLTSYKVLANLNRNDALEKKAKDKPSVANTLVHDDNTQECDNPDEEPSSGRKTTETLETNLANINVNKLDSAYDIDPLFHKMSKTFDEGGAKGLLLVNLGIGTKGCNIVFDSKEEDDEEQMPNYDFSTEGMLDITSLTAKLDIILGHEKLDNIELVPQLRTLRQEYAALEREGFISEPQKKSRRYATSMEEEKEAEMSIHQDFLERSRMSATSGRLSSGNTENDFTKANIAADDQEYAADDCGFDDDDDGDFGFDQFISNDQYGERYSSVTFEEGKLSDETEATKATSALLDALCHEMTENDYQFFSQESLDKLGNSWAGAAHWKKTTNLSRVIEKKDVVVKKKVIKKKKNKIPWIDFNADISTIHDLLRPAQVSSRGTNPIQLSKSMMTKYGNTDNLLPLDAKMEVSQLQKLFLRPNATIRPNQKTVNFRDNVDNWDDGSFGDNDHDDGNGFELRDDNLEDVIDNYEVAELADVRKIDKIQIAYATVSKKVDVKRLKNDLWTELESKLGDLNDGNTVDSNESGGQCPQISRSDKKLSFQQTVQEMDKLGQTQADVTLPFYFICLLHLANEKGLELESQGLADFFIST